MTKRMILSVLYAAFALALAAGAGPAEFVAATLLCGLAVATRVAWSPTPVRR